MEKVPDISASMDAQGRLINQPPAYDMLLNAEFQIQVGEKLAPAKVMRRMVGPSGEQLGDI